MGVHMGVSFEEQITIPVRGCQGRLISCTHLGNARGVENPLYLQLRRGGGEGVFPPM
jgi:hypothetical protein